MPWAADAPARVLTSLGIRRDLLGGRFEPPDEATIRRSWNGWMPLPWHQVPVIYDSQEKGHGRAEWRTLKTAAVAAGLAFPHAAQAIQIRRRRRPLNGTSRWSTKTTYAITSLTASQATPA